MIRAGNASGVPKKQKVERVIKYQELSIDYESETRILRWGSAAKKCCCKKPSHEEISSCVSSANESLGTYIPGINTCQQDVQRAVEGCCLDGYTANFGFGPDEAYFEEDKSTEPVNLDERNPFDILEFP